MHTPTALILTAPGINCDGELAEAFRLAGAAPEFVHLNRLMREPAIVERYDLVGLPGGFSFGDAVAAGRIAAQLMRQAVYQSFVRAIERGVAVIAPCNGFQIAVQMGLLPGPPPGAPWPNEAPAPTVALAANESARFIDRWVAVEITRTSRCIWTHEIDAAERVRMLPIAHGEGRFTPESESLIAQLDASGQIAVKYASNDNPNGSSADVAGICDATGLVFGLMPHPERFTRWTHHPFWTRLAAPERAGEPLGLAIFRNAVAHALQVTA